MVKSPTPAPERDLPSTAPQLAAAWPRILARVATPEHAQGVKLFLSTPKVRPSSLADGVLVVDCPTPMYQDQIRKRFAVLLAAAATAELGLAVTQVSCRVTGPASREHERRVAAVQAEVEAAPAPATDRPRAATGHGFKELTSFVVGSCNRLAYDAVLQILEHPRKAPNPLFIHGASGLGKTHLEQGLARAFKERYPKAKVEYLRCEHFFRMYMEANEGGPEAMKAFHVRMRHPDLLLIDDLHFLSKGDKVRTKDELLATFETLAEHGKRMVLTSDARPRDIQYLEERFIQRVHGGLVVELLRPDRQVRLDVLAQAARSRDLALSDEVFSYIADRLTDNIRELEGAVNRLAQFSKSFGRKIDLAAVRQALADLVANRDEPVEQIVLRAVAAHFAVPVEAIASRSRAGNRSMARMVAVYVMKSAGSATYAEIGRAVGVKSHGSVAHACERIARERSQDAELDKFIADLLLRLKQR
jgi:chromosomal replication initiator protein